MPTHLSILIVDDEFGLAEMLREMLGDYGHDVTLAINGRLALDILAERKVDLVITDIMMPVMDGSELATAMRNSEAHCDIPIVMMTSLPSGWPQQRELFDGVLRKPFVNPNSVPGLRMGSWPWRLCRCSRCGVDDAE